MQKVKVLIQKVQLFQANKIYSPDDEGFIFSSEENKDEVSTIKDASLVIGNEPQIHKKCIKENKPRVSCTECGNMMRKDCLSRHIKQFHQEKVPSRCVCVNENDAVYMVTKTKSGVGYPIHVQKLLHGTKAKKRFCEEKFCMEYMAICSNSGLKNALCDHLEEVNERAINFPTKVVLDENVLYSMASNREDGECILKDATITLCCELNSLAVANECVPVVPFENNRFLHLSVFSDKVHYKANLRRFVVSYDTESGTLDCGCCVRKTSCVHKAMSLWFLKQTDCLASVEEFEDVPAGVDNPCTKIDEKEGVSSTIYPPYDDIILEKMMKYLHEFKRYNDIQKYRLFNKAQIPLHIMPTETICRDCNSRLSKPIKVTHDAKILSFQGIFSGYYTYVKCCTQCKIFYRYEECQHGIHNFDDRFFLGIDVRLYIREHVQQHNSIGSFVESISRLHQCTLNHKTVLNAFLLFDVLVTESYDFHCVVCGYHPWALVMDLNKKIAFKCAANEVADSEDKLRN